MRGDVYLIDDDGAVQRGVKALLSAAGFGSSVFGSAEAFLSALPNLNAQGSVGLVDVCMPGMHGPELLTHLKKTDVRIPVIIMTAHGDIQMAVAAMREGAVDFLEKPFTADELIGALDRAFALANSKSQLSGPPAEDLAARLESLTPREQQVLTSIVEGQTSKAIGRELGLSPRTVEVHRRNIMSKMQAACIADLVRLAISGGW